jgi:HK97 gp10 family phage protein
MAADVEFKLEGVEELEARLETLTFETQRKGGRFALRRAAQVIRNAARENAQRFDDPDTGRKIADNIAERWNNAPWRARGDLAFKIGVLKGAKIRRTGNPDEGAKGATPHWRLLEFGTEHMSAQPFMRPAMEQNLSKAGETFIIEYNKAIDRALKRAARRGETA